MNSISPNMNLMIKACEKASKVIVRDFGEIENLQVTKKGPKMNYQSQKKISHLLLKRQEKF